jgi:hypothetical protein
MRYRNVSDERHIWPHLVDAGTGRTLDLAPGEDAEISGRVADPGPLLAVIEPKPRTKPKPEPAADHTEEN